MKSSVAVVTGGNKGIGLGIAKLLLKNNYKVIYIFPNFFTS